MSIYKQVGKLTNLMQENLLDTPSRKTKPIPISQVMVVYIEEEEELEHMGVLDSKEKQSNQSPKEEEKVKKYREAV